MCRLWVYVCSIFEYYVELLLLYAGTTIATAEATYNNPIHRAHTFRKSIYVHMNRYIFFGIKK